METKIEINNEEKTGTFFTSYFNKKEHVIPEIEIPESLSLAVDSEGEEEEEEEDEPIEEVTEKSSSSSESGRKNTNTNNSE